MNISDYARSRTTTNTIVTPSAVSMYIRRNPEIFNGHISKSKNGKETFLDDEAIKQLDKKYYIPEPIQVYDIDPICERKLKEAEQTIQTLSENIKKLQAAYDLLLAENHENQLKLADANKYKELQEIHTTLLKEKNNDLTEAKKNITLLYNMLETEKTTTQEIKLNNELLKKDLAYAQQHIATTEQTLNKKEDEIATLLTRIEQAENEANSFIKSWFGFWRKKT
nr:unnamed protein product [uncultured bacterium]